MTMSTIKANLARKRKVAAIRGGYVIGVYSSLKDCSIATGIPSSRICEYARSGRVFKNGYEFRYL